MGALTKEQISIACCALKAMMPRLFNLIFLVLVISTSWANAATNTHGKTIVFDIPQQRADGALTALANQADISVVFDYDAISQYQVNALKGDYAIRQAVELLLADTGLKFEFDGGRHLIITQFDDLDGDGVMGIKAKKSILAATVAFFIGSGESQEIAAQDATTIEELNWMIEEIIVTATKRDTSLQDTAMAISVLGEDMIDKRNLVGMGDYLNSLPGVSVLDQGPGFNSIIIRGLSVSPQFEGADSSPISGVYFGETAISGFGILGNSADIKLVDMERIEVIRGPQGTLYGAGAMGGVVRNIPNSPNLEKIEGMLQVGYSNTAKEGGGNNLTKGVVNIPLIKDVFAVRAVAYRFDDSGYYKNIAGSDPAAIASGAVTNYSAVARDQDNIGDSEVTGARISALWQPMEPLTVNLSYLKQDIEQDGTSGQTEFDLPGAYTQSRFALRTSPTGSPDQPESLTDDIEITNLIVSYDMDWATLTSSSSWVDEKSELNQDRSAATGDTIPFSAVRDYTASLFSEEIRLTSQLDGRWQFLVGYYYEERETGFLNPLFFSGEDPALSDGVFGVGPGEVLIVNNTIDRELDQQAFFGELSYDVTDSVKVTVGGRAFDYDRTFTNGDRPGGAIVLNGSSPDSIKSNENDTSLKVSLDYRPNDATLLYMTWSEGFRLGYPIPAASPLVVSRCDLDNDGIFDDSGGVSLSARGIDSDYVENFELGGKFLLLNERLTVNVAAYQIDWDGIPVTAFFNPSCAAAANAGNARSRGVELELSYQWTENLLINISSSYVDAELTEDALSLNANKGDRLPGSPDVNANLGLEYQFTLGGNDAYLRSDYTYVGGFYNNLQEVGTEAGDYGKLNAKVGMFINKFSIDFFIDNLTNEDAITSVDAQFPDNRGNRLRPRTIGLNIGYQF